MAPQKIRQSNARRFPGMIIVRFLILRATYDTRSMEVIMSRALEIAAERYAKGEITKEEFAEIKSSLSEHMTTPSKNTSAVPPLHVHEAPPPLPRNSSATATAVEMPPPVNANAPAPTAPTTPVYQRSYFDIAFIGGFLKFLVYLNLGISFVMVFAIFRTSGVQAKYNIVYSLENEEFFLWLVGIPALLAMVVYLYWKKKSTDNLFLLRGPQDITPAGAVYWYFVPVAWFWKPYEAMRNLVYGFNVAETDRWALPVWWFLFWGTIMIQIIVAAASPETITTESQANAYVNWTLVILVADMAWLLIAGGLIKEVTEAQVQAVNQAKSTG